MKKPIKVFYSILTRRFYATNHYRTVGPGQIECTGEKFDVTNDIAGLMEENNITFKKREDDHGPSQG